MLSAADARSLMPKLSIDAILTQIEHSVREAAWERKKSTPIQHLIPDWAKWAVGKPLPEHLQLQDVLQNAGYAVVLDAGGHGECGSVRLIWEVDE